MRHFRGFCVVSLVLMTRRMKTSGQQFDDRVVEVAWDMKTENWRILRFRDDKPHANHHTVVNSVLESIKDGVELDEVRHFGTCWTRPKT